MSGASNNPVPFAATPREELQRYIVEVESGDLRWYTRAAWVHYRFWLFMELVALVAGFLAAIVAGLIQDEVFKTYGRWLLVIIPAVGSLAGSMLAVFRFREMEDLRERG